MSLKSHTRPLLMFRLQQYPIPSSSRPERTACLAELPLDLCAELFEANAQADADWILQSQIGLKGQCPIDLLSTPAVKRSETY